MRSLSEQISSVKREINMREGVYPRWVSQNKMNQAKADYEIECMKSVLRTLEIRLEEDNAQITMQL